MRTAAVGRAGGAGIAATVLLLAWTVAWALDAWPVSGLSWHFFAEGSDQLLHSSGLHVYADHPELQTGPLALVVAAVLQPLSPAAAQRVALVLMTAVGPLLLAALATRMPVRRRTARVFLAGVFLLPAWTVLSVRWGHLDDVLAMAVAVGAVCAVSARRPAWAGVALAAAITSKPWAIGFLPLVLALPAHRVRAALLAAAGTAIAWLPFVLADPGTLTALRPNVALVPSSGLHTLGARGEVVPAWGRTAQLLLAPAAALAVVLSRRWTGVLLVAVAVRLALDPQDNAYYVGGAAVAAVVFDLLGTTWTVPWTTIVTVVVLWQPFVLDYPHRLTTTGGLTHWWFAHPGEVGALHLAWCVAAVAVVVLVPPRPTGRLPVPGDRRTL